MFLSETLSASTRIPALWSRLSQVKKTDPFGFLNTPIGYIAKDLTMKKYLTVAFLLLAPWVIFNCTTIQQSRLSDSKLEELEPELYVYETETQPSPACHHIQPMKKIGHTSPWAEQPEQTSYVRVFNFSHCDRPKQQFHIYGSKEQLHSYSQWICEQQYGLKFGRIDTHTITPSTGSYYKKINPYEGRMELVSTKLTHHAESIVEVHCSVENVKSLRKIERIQYATYLQANR